MSEHPHDDPEHPGKPPGDPDHPEHPHGTPPGQDKPEEPEETPEHPIAPDEAPAPVNVVEPALGLAEFVAVRPMREAAKAMLRRWLKAQGHDANGHYPLAQWRELNAAMLAST